MEREFKDSGIEWIGRIPKEWKTCMFKHAHKNSNVGESIDKNYCTENQSDLLFYTAGLKPIHTNYKDFPQWKYTNRNDLLLARNGTPYVYLPTYNSVYSDHIIRVDIKSAFSKAYVRYCLQLAISAVIVDSVSIATWSISIWDKQFIPIPLLPEQQRIADYLDKKCGEIDELIALQEQMIAQLTDYKQSVITEAVTKGLDPDAELVPSGIDWIGDVPKGWKVARIKNVASLFGRIGFRGYTSEDLNKDGEGAITLSPSNMLPMCMDYTNVTYLSWAKYYESPEIMIQNNDLLMVKTGSSYGKVSYVDNLPREATINPQILRIIPKISSKFLGYYMQTPLFLYQVEGGVVGGTIPTISQEKINNFKLLLPSKNEQNDIVKYLDSICNKIDSLIAIKQQKIETLKDYKKSVIYEAVTGKLTV